jgi:PAS domain S-box-containing protein
MALLRNLGLLTKITVVVTAILLVFFVVATFIDYRLHKGFIIAESVEKARIIAAAAIRSREYISDQLQVGHVELSVERYGLIPVVASTRIGELVARDLDYRIQQVSDRYRNPKNAPDSFESETLQKFYTSPHLKEYYTITSFQGDPVFRYMQPFRAEESCLECHGDPQTAPDYIKRLFPEAGDRAYNYKIGEIIGAASVTIPMEKLYKQIYANVRNDLFYTGGLILAMITCLGLLTRGTVTAPLTRLGEGIREIVRTGSFDVKIPRRGRDEIGALIDGFNEMMDHLQEKSLHLEESEKRYRVLTETARDGILSFLGNGQVILFNREAERMFGYSKLEALGMTIDRFIHEECRSVHEAGIEAYLRQHGGELLRKTQRIPGRRRDGSPLYLELSLSVAESDGHLFYTAFLREPAHQA